LFVFLYCFPWPLRCLIFFDIRILITLLVYLNSSHKGKQFIPLIRHLHVLYFKIQRICSKIVHCIYTRVFAILSMSLATIWFFIHLCHHRLFLILYYLPQEEFKGLKSYLAERSILGHDQMLWIWCHLMIHHCLHGIRSKSCLPLASTLVYISFWSGQYYSSV